ncbi:hypothetical protein Tco_1528123 [Tanacetum coccineum]
MVTEIRTRQTKEPEQTLEDEFKDLHLNLPVLKVLAHAPMYNAILDKYMESLELGENGFAFIQGEMPKRMEDHILFTLHCRLGDSKPFDTLADLGACVNIISLADGTKSCPVGIVRDVEVHIGILKLLNDFYVIDMKKDPETPLQVVRGFLATSNVVIDCRKAKIAVGEGITRSLFGVKAIKLGEEEAPYWTTLGKRESYKPRPSWDKPPKNRDGEWHAKIRLIDPDGEEFTKTLQSVPTSRKLSERESPREIINLNHFYEM